MHSIVLRDMNVALRLPPTCTEPFLSRLSLVHRGMVNDAQYRTSRHECRGTFCALYRDISVASPPRGAHIENQPTGYEEALSQLSGPGSDTGHLLECRGLIFWASA